MSMLAKLARHITWKHLSYFFGAHFHHRLSERMMIDTLDRARREIPFYYDRLAALDSNPDQPLRQRLRAVPILDRDTIRAHYPGDLLNPSLDAEALITTTTSGTSGYPLSFAYSKQTHAHRLSVYMRYLWELGYRPWHKVAYMLSRPRVPVYPFGLFFRFLHLSSLFSVEDQANVLMAEKPDILNGFSSHVVSLATYVSDQRLPLRFRFVWVGAEPISLSELAFVSRVFDCPVYQSYGAEEIGMIAGTCSMGRWHISTDNVFLEIIDNNGEEVPDGEPGEAVLTTLNNRAMPLIRYRLGDIVVRSGAHCPCGSPFPILASFEGRTADVFVLRDGREVMPMAIAGVADSFLDQRTSFFDAFRIVQKTVDRVVVEFTAGEAYDPDEALQLVAALRALVGETVQIDLEAVERVEQHGQKRRMIVSNVPRAPRTLGRETLDA